MDAKHSAAYTLLGLDDAARWEDVRLHYRRQVMRWHPDRCEQRGLSKTEAEQRFIDIHTAYKSLSQFYRHHGHLPLERSNHQAANGADFSRIEPKPAASVEGEPESFAPEQVRSVRPARGQRATLKRVLAVLISVFLACAVLLGYDSWQASQEAQQRSFNEGPDTVVDSPLSRDFAKSLSDGNF